MCAEPRLETGRPPRTVRYRKTLDMSRRRILFALLAATLALTGYLRLQGEPRTWRQGGLVPPHKGADRWLRKHADSGRQTTLRLFLPCDITLDGWRAIGDMKSLQWVEIQSTEPGQHQLLPSAEGLRELARLPRDSMPSLSIWFAEMTAPAMQALAAIPELRRLDIAYLALDLTSNPIDDAGIAHLPSNFSTFARLSSPMRGWSIC